VDAAVIRTQGLTKLFGREEAVCDLTFDVPRGTVFGFIGPSGCGKTTTVRLLTGVYRPTAGEATVLGSDPARFTQRTRSRIGYMPQHFALYQDLTVWANLNFAASIYGLDPRRSERLEEVLDFVELSDHKHKRAHDLSGGMQRRLSLAATLAHAPDLVFLDEPTAGIDPVLRHKFWQHFQGLKNEGRTLFITTQYVNEAAYCDQVGVLVRGHLLAVDTPEELRRRAFGGDVIDLRTSTQPQADTIDGLRELAFVRDVRRLDDEGLRVTVAEASTAIPLLLQWSQKQGIQVESVEEYLPPFDDVFVELVEEEPMYAECVTPR
jgi:ABC-2 type transport system ATP-binding protein